MTIKEAKKAIKAVKAAKRLQKYCENRVGCVGCIFDDNENCMIGYNPAEYNLKNIKVVTDE